MSLEYTSQTHSLQQVTRGDVGAAVLVCLPVIVMEKHMFNVSGSMYGGERLNTRMASVI